MAGTAYDHTTKRGADFNPRGASAPLPISQAKALRRPTPASVLMISERPMRVLLLAATAGPLLAQSADRGVQYMTDQLMSHRPPLAAPQAPNPVKAPAAVPSPGKPCSVPLVEMQIPSGVEFTMRQLVPPKETDDQILGKVPAPACPR